MKEDKISQEIEKSEEVEKSVIDKYTKEIDIPSQGYLGGPKRVTIRAMTTVEEKILYSSRDNSFIKRICKSCTVSPKVLDTNKLLPADLYYMIFQIRELTFGPTYKQPIRCPYCKLQQDAEINIADFEYKLLDDDIDSKLSIELPISKAKVQLKLISQDAVDEAERASIKLFQDGKISDLEGYTLVRKLSAMIDSVVGMVFESENDKIAYVNNMHLMDLNAIRNTLNSVDFGLKTDVTVKCQNTSCNEDMEVIGTICPEFFRPTI
jgi:hypothetical protein